MNNIEEVAESIISEIKFAEIHLLVEQLIKDDFNLAEAMHFELLHQLNFHSRKQNQEELEL